MTPTGSFGHGRPPRNMRNAWVVALAGAFASLAPAATARAAYTQLTQTRSLTASTSASVSTGLPGNHADSENSDTLGSIVDHVVISGASSFPTTPSPPFFPSALSSSRAFQSVQLTPTSISGSIVGDADAESLLGEAGASAGSTWSTTFRVDAPTPFDLDGALSVRDRSSEGTSLTGSHSATFSFTRRADAGGDEETPYRFTVDSVFSRGAINSRPIDLAGVLEPGYVYSLAAAAAASRSSRSFVRANIIEHSTAEVSFTLSAAPEPAAAGLFALCAPLLLRRRRA